MKPNVYLFNPTCELAVANSSANFMASANLRRFEDELSTLPGILAQPNDLVIVDRQPPQQFKDQLESAGFLPPLYRPMENFLSDPSCIPDEIGFLFPWGWSPSAHKLLQPFKSACSSDFLNSPVAEWHEIQRELYSRRSSLDILTGIITNGNLCNVLTLNDLPEICTNHDDIIRLQQKWGQVVVKAPWSASGRGLQVLRPNEYNQTNRQVISGILKQQGYVVAGPWHNKVFDLSFQFFSFGNGNIEYKGLTSFSTDRAGHYVSNNIQEFPPDLNPEIEEFLKQNIPEIKNALHDTLNRSNYSSDYYGWIGADAMIFRSDQGDLKFHPCLEINCRFTMGAVALSLRDHLASGSTGKFRISQGTEGQFQQFCREKAKKESIIVESGKIIHGFLPLTPYLPNSHFGAFMSIRSNNGNQG